MKNQHIARLEAHLEQLIEGAFASLFGKKIRAQDIALRLARAMEDNVKKAQGSDPRPLAPDQYAIFMNPSVQKTILEQHPDLPQILSEHMVELATQSGYRLNGNPLINILADADLAVGNLIVMGHHSDHNAQSTASMHRVILPPVEKPQNAQLIVDDRRSIQLQDSIINIGRNGDNHIILDDPYVSRHHIQLRLRFGTYILFDVRSHSGTFVNGIQVKEHHLKTGDVIRIGKTQMIYLQDDPSNDTDTGQTEAFEPFL